MTRFLRIITLWLLALALPVQGVAAQGLRLCAPQDPAPLHVMHPMMMAAAQAAGEMAPCEGHDEASVTAVADEGLDPSGHADHQGKCSACASCCGAPALAASSLVPRVTPAKAPEVATVVAAHSRVLVGGLERPPRSLRP